MDDNLLPDSPACGRPGEAHPGEGACDIARDLLTEIDAALSDPSLALAFAGHIGRSIAFHERFLSGQLPGWGETAVRLRAWLDSQLPALWQTGDRRALAYLEVLRAVVLGFDPDAVVATVVAVTHQVVQACNTDRHEPVTDGIITDARTCRCGRIRRPS